MLKSNFIHIDLYYFRKSGFRSVAKRGLIVTGIDIFLVGTSYNPLQNVNIPQSFEKWIRVHKFVYET